MPDLRIRAAEPTDADGLVELSNLPGVRHGTLRMPYTSRSTVQKGLEGRPGVHILVAVLGGEGAPAERVIGQVVLMQQQGRRSHAGEVYLFVHDDYVGQGVGTALMTALLDLADHWIGLRRVELTVNTDNARAIRLYERCGFEHEGTRRADVLRDGELVDCHSMARLRDAPPRRA
jgi:L-phenylalanine/L-methionine N-acetyltransferase